MPESFDPQQKAELDRHAGGTSSAMGVNQPESAVESKLRFLERLLGRRFDRPVLDFGCGIGTFTERLAQRYAVVHGYDPSSDAALLAKKRTPSATFFDDPEDLPKQHYGCVVLADVLHHVPPPNRAGLLRTIAGVLAPRGRLVVFEHNPLNPLTRRAVAVSAYDENSELLYPWQLKRLLKRAGLVKVQLDYLAFFPAPLAFAARLERRLGWLGWLPLGTELCAWGARA